MTKNRGGRRPGAGRPYGTSPQQSHTIRFDERLWRRVQAAAEAQGVTASSWVRSVVTRALGRED